MRSQWATKPPSKSEQPLGGVHAKFSWTPLGRALPTIRELELTIEPGERVLLLGRSGSGKSTILHGLTGALATTLPGAFTGEISVGGRIGFVPQNPSDGIVAEHLGRDIAFGPENLGLDREEIWQRVGQARDAVGLPYEFDHLTSALSGGEQQRLSLAGVLAMEADIMLLDEPTSMLDAATARRVRDSVLEIAGNRTLIVVEHRFEPWLEHVDRVIVLESGEIICDTTPERLPVLPGLWHPHAKPPQIHPVSEALVLPETQPQSVVVSNLAVDVVSRTLRGSQKVRAIEAFSAEFAAGEQTALMGPSGSGKSTVLLAVAGLVKITGGEVIPNRSKMKSKALAATLGWVPQNPEHGFLRSSVRDEVLATAHKLGRAIDPEQVLGAVGLERYADAHPYRLSGGEQRRLALAAALAHRPGLLLMDEPSVGQDPDSWALIAGWLATAAKVGATVAFATHDVDLPADACLQIGGEQ